MALFIGYPSHKPILHSDSSSANILHTDFLVIYEINWHKMENAHSIKYKRERIALLSLIIVNFVFYSVFLIWFPVASGYIYAVYSVPIIAVYYIIESSCFFGCNMYSWAATCTFRIFWLIHDFSYFVTYAVMASRSYYCYDDYWYKCYKKSYLIATCVFFWLVFCIGIAIICIFSKLPGNYCCYSPVYPQQIVVQPPAMVQQQPQVVQVMNPAPYGQAVQVQPNYVVQQQLPMTVAQPAYVVQNRAMVVPPPYQPPRY